MNRKISSLHCLFSYDNKLGGSVHAALNVCKYLVALGQDVEVVAPYDTKDDISYLANNYPEVCCNRVARSFPKRYANSRELGRWLENNIKRFDVVEIHGVWVLATMQAVRVCIKQGVPFFIRPHGSLDPFDLKKHSFLKMILGPVYVHWALSNAAGVICTADLEADRMLDYGAASKRYAIPLPVPLEVQPGDRQAFRARHNIPPDAQVVLFLSRVDYKKGLDFLIPALGKLRREFSRLWFVLAGTGTPEFSRHVERWLLDENVRCITSEVGFVSGREKQDAFASADIFALPSRNENFGIVNIEAMHAGLALLVSDEVYICREIEGAGAGLVCKPSVDSVTENLREMLCGLKDLKAMGQKGRELVRARYHPEAATTALIQLYNKTVTCHRMKQ